MTRLAEEGGAIVLPARSDTPVAVALRDRILAAEGDVTLDARAVSVLTTPVLQVLMAGRDHLAGRGRALAIVAPSDGFEASLRTLGVPFDRVRTSGVAS